MPRAVLDANIWVLAAHKFDSIPGVSVRLIEDQIVTSVLSNALLDQVLRTLRKLGFSETRVRDVQTDINRWSEFVDPAFRLAVITAKESDNRVLECAIAGHADVIVTGDRKHLLPLVQYEDIPIISPREFVDTYR